MFTEENYNLRWHSLLKEKYARAIVEKAEELSYGTFETLGEAKQMAGIIEGLRLAQTLASEVLTQLEKDDV